MAGFGVRRGQEVKGCWRRGPPDNEICGRRRGRDD
jgi:hypothetical protein